MTVPFRRWWPRPIECRLLAMAILGWLQIVLATPGWVVAAPSALALDDYGFVVTFDPGTRTLSGSMDVTWMNATPIAQSALPFRLYPNAAYYEDGELTVRAARVDGEAAFIQLSFDPTVIEVDLGMEVAPGETVQVSLDFETVVPDAPDASFGILGGDTATGWRLADWYPVVAGWEDGSWYLAPPTLFGDPTFPASATWEMKLTAPSEYTAITSGSETVIARDVDGMDVTRIVAGPGRDLSLTLVPGESGLASGDADGIPVVVSGSSSLASPDLGREIADTVAASLPVLASWMGAYPGSELDIVLTSLAGAPAVSWNGLIWVDPDRFLADGVLDDAARERLRFTLFHELAHQWIPGVAGSNNNDHGFMSEGLANALAVLAARDVYGVDVAKDWLERYVTPGYLRELTGGGDGVADAPLTPETNLAARNAFVYGKAAVGFEAIRQQIGDAAFFSGLGAYVEQFRNLNSGPDDLKAAWEASSGQVLDDLWRFWFEEAAATPDDVARVVDGFA